MDAGMWRVFMKTIEEDNYSCYGSGGFFIPPQKHLSEGEGEAVLSSSHMKGQGSGAYSVQISPAM
jgi:hypothetical protein